jgi:hypothetical protein
MSLIYPDHPRFFAKYPCIIKNNSGEEIPPCGVMRIESAADVDGMPVYTVGKPNGTYYREYLVCSPVGIPSGGEGYGGFLNEGGYVYYSGGTPALGGEYGMTKDQWYLTEKRSGFVTTAETTTFNSKTLVLARGYALDKLLGKPASSIALNASGTVNVWAGTAGSETVITDVTVASCFNKTGSGSYTTSDFVIVSWLGGQPYISKFVC